MFLDFCFGIGGRILDLGDLMEDRFCFGLLDILRLFMNFRFWVLFISMGRFLFCFLFFFEGDNIVGLCDCNGDRGEFSFLGEVVFILWLLFVLEIFILFFCLLNIDSCLFLSIGIDILDFVLEL